MTGKNEELKAAEHRGYNRGYHAGKKERADDLVAARIRLQEASDRIYAAILGGMAAHPTSMVRAEIAAKLTREAMEQRPLV